MLAAGCGMPGQLLAADPGYRGPRVPCGAGHEAEFVSYRDKVTGTVPGPVTLTRAWYHCAECMHGLAPRDAGLGVAGASMSPGLAAMNDLAAAAGPFAGAARLLEELAGIRLTARRAGRAAEASGAIVAEAGRERARLIASRKLVPLPPSPLPDKLYAVIDGTGVPMTGRETAGRQGKGEDGRARTREVKPGVFFTQDKLDEDGYPVPQQRATHALPLVPLTRPVHRLRRRRGQLQDRRRAKTQAGRHWTVAGADAIIALRCKEASSQREAICHHRHNQTRAA